MRDKTNYGISGAATRYKVSKNANHAIFSALPGVKEVRYRCIDRDVSILAVEHFARIPPCRLVVNKSQYFESIRASNKSVGGFRVARGKISACEHNRCALLHALILKGQNFAE